MTLLSTYQEIQAQHFVESNHAEVDRVRQAIMQAGNLLLNNIGKSVLPPEDLTVATKAQAQGDMLKLFGVLRQQAALFVIAKCSGPYWAWIDAAGAFFDATGSQWRYLTLERRRFALCDAKESLTDVRF